MKIRRIVTVAAALVAAVAVAGYAIIASLDVQQVAEFAKKEVKAATGRDLTIAGPVDLQVSLTPSIQLRDVRFANASWGSRADMVSIRRLEVEVALLPLLTGNVVVKRLVAIDPDILLETGPKGQGNWDFASSGSSQPSPEPAQGSKGAAITLPDVQDFRIQGGVLRLEDKAAGKALQLDVTEAVGSLPSGGGTRHLRLNAAYNGNPISVDGSYGGLPALLSGAPTALDVTVEAGGAKLTVKGTAGDLTGAAKADLALTAAGQSLADLSAWAGSDLPPLGPYNLSGDLNIDGQKIDLSGLSMKIGGSDLAGNLGLSLAGARPLVKASLVSKSLDLADLTGKGGSAAGAAGASGAGGGSKAAARVFPDTPLPLDALRAVDAQVKLDAEKVRLSNVVLEALQATLALKAGDLTVKPLTATLAGGSLDGQLSLAAAKAQPDTTFRLDGKGIDFGALLRQAGVTEGIGGSLDLAVDLKGRGGSPHAIASDLGGYAQAVSQNGTIDNTLLSVLSAGLGDIVGPLFGKSDKTRLECFVSRFDFDKGQGKSRALVLDTGAFAVSGRGGIDLASEQVNLAFDTETSEPSLASLAVPFRVTGPLDNPSVTPDPIGAAVGVVGTVGNVAKAGGNIVGGAVDTVGGLLGTGPIIGHIGSDKTLCGEALAAVGRGAPASGAASQSSSGSTSQTSGGTGQSGQSSGGGVANDVGNALKGAGEGIKKGLNSLFGN